ncbi:uncharacterized protein N7443_005319 [Penicillium atrosanguineum]|nr:uncharacterized protein N7443_005319 [Penicillium atrosanguineum]KAJ5300317.1 hypothetical protein N7443_005319 [Penicillium atrosanguineum]
MAEAENSVESPNMPSNETKRHWIPTSLRRPYLFSVATFFLLTAIAIECLRQYSSRHHGLVHLKSYTVLGEFTSGMYTYAPTAFAVLAAALWNVCALDVLRLEPYFQLAKPEGISGTILFTNYCFFYGIVAPIMAIRNRHWTVACVSLIGLILRMMLPSLLSGLIVLDEANIVAWQPVNIWPSLLSLEKQNAWLTEEAFRSRNGSQFTTDTSFFYGNPEYAIPPISRPGHWAHHRDSMWELHHPIYWADLTCTKISLNNLVFREWYSLNSTSSAAQHSSTGLTGDIRNIRLQNPLGATAGSECSLGFSLNVSKSAQTGSFQIRHWEPLAPNGSADSTSTMNYTGCASFSLIGLAIDINTVSPQGTSSNATVFGCSSLYLHSMADIVLPSNTSVAAVKNVSRPKTTLTAKELSVTGLQAMLFAKYFNGDLALWNMGYPHPIPEVTGLIAVNGTSIGAHKPMDVSIYQEEIIGLWKSHFIITMNKFFDTTAGPKHVYAKQTTDKIIFGVASHSAFIAEAIFLTAFLVLVTMAFIYPRRLSFLKSDPGSIAAQCAIVTDILASTEHVTRSDIDFYKSTPRQLRRFAKTLSCQWVEGPDGKRLDITPCEKHATSPDSHASRAAKPARVRPNARPHFLKPTYFIIECVLLAGVLSAFGVSVQFITMDKFDDYLSPGATILYLYLIYGPTVIASVISTLFTSVHRHLSFIEPWVRLQQGMSLPGLSLSTNYAAHTPLTIWKQLRINKPVLLILLSLICLLNFLLIIVSSGLFEPVVYQWFGPTTDLSIRYNLSRFLDPDVRVEFHGYNFIADTLASEESLLSWTTTNTSFIPLEIDSEDAEYVDWLMYTARTRGVGVDLQCAKIPSIRSSVDSGTYSWTYNPNKGSIDTNCTVKYQKATDGQHSSNGSLYLAMPEDGDISCQNSFVVIKCGDSSRATTTLEPYPTAFYCKPQIEIQNFDIYFDSMGLIKAQWPVTGSAITSGAMFQNASNSLLPFNEAFIQLDWPVILTQHFYDSIQKRRITSVYQSQDEDISLRAIQLIYQSTFSIYTSLWRDLYLDPIPLTTPQVTVNGTVAEAEWGIAPSSTILVIMIIILSLDLSVLMAVFLLRHKCYNGLPTPRSIGSLIPWVQHTRMLSDFHGTAEWSEGKRQSHLESLGRRYRFGEFEVLSGTGRPKTGALDWDEEEKMDRNEEYQLLGASSASCSTREGGMVVLLTAVGSEPSLFNTDTTAHML